MSSDLSLARALAILAGHDPDMVSIHDPEGVYLHVSASAAAVVGWTPSELVGHSAYEFFHPEDVGDIEVAHLSNLVKKGREPIRYRYRSKQGDYQWVETWSRGVPGSDDLGLCFTRIVGQPA